MTYKQVIEEFLETTPKWLEAVYTELELLESKDGSCFVCGIRPKNMELLMEAVKELQEKTLMYEKET